MTRKISALNAATTSQQRGHVTSFINLLPLSIPMKDIIANLLAQQLKKELSAIAPLIEIPHDTNNGDYAFPCFTLAKEIKKNPVEIAKELASQLKLSNELEKIEAKGPYLNFFANRSLLAQQTLKTILKEKDKYGSKKKKNTENVVIEFSQANTHKAFHIGHVRGTSLGESLARIASFSGDKVTRANYQGDTGMHVAKWLWCYQTFHKNEPLKQDEGWIASLYVEAVKRLSEHPEDEQKVVALNHALESRADKTLITLWKKTRKLSLDAFESIYQDLGTRFDVYFFESEVEARGKEISGELVKKGIAELSEGATIVRLEQDNLGVWVLLRKDDTVLYSAKDLALAERKFNEFKVDRSVYVVGAAQRHHFMQLFTTLRRMQFKQAAKCTYVPVSEVRLPWGKMSSRTGDNVLYSDFKKEIIEYAQQEIKKRHPSISPEDLTKRALGIAIAAIKYDMLKQDVNKSLIFNKEESLKFEGDTGPYLLYTYARAQSILTKAKKSHVPPKLPALTEKEKQLVVQLTKFPNVVQAAYASFAPNLIANYAYHLAQAFNEFYHSHPVIDSKEEAFRLQLVTTFCVVFKNALSLLGIPVLKKM